VTLLAASQLHANERHMTHILRYVEKRTITSQSVPFSSSLMLIMHLLVDIAVYQQHRACLREVEKSLHCFGTYPPIIRLAPWDKARRQEFQETAHDEHSKEVDVTYYGFSVHQ